ncbi:hypothetical protein [Neptuniibacter sp. QD37_11]|uniref:hypothetical protein n=1 Tax=Neptuniibacter sp. QD37_11 TaxID=3398209 RepID=UPI0039F5F206
MIYPLAYVVGGTPELKDDPNNFFVKIFGNAEDREAYSLGLKEKPLTENQVCSPKQAQLYQEARALSKGFVEVEIIDDAEDPRFCTFKVPVKVLNEFATEPPNSWQGEINLLTGTISYRPFTTVPLKGPFSFILPADESVIPTELLGTREDDIGLIYDLQADLSRTPLPFTIE